tara:strand:+ start:527 stop:655 length:129 start_codon:yes stop_codon:yes gene_type:complete
MQSEPRWEAMIIVCQEANTVRQIKEDNLEEVFAITDNQKALS